MPAPSGARSGRRGVLGPLWARKTLQNPHRCRRGRAQSARCLGRKASGAARPPSGGRLRMGTFIRGQSMVSMKIPHHQPALSIKTLQWVLVLRRGATALFRQDENARSWAGKRSTRLLAGPCLVGPPPANWQTAKGCEAGASFSSASAVGARSSGLCHEKSQRLIEAGAPRGCEHAGRASSMLPLRAAVGLHDLLVFVTICTSCNIWGTAQPTDCEAGFSCRRTHRRQWRQEAPLDMVSWS